LPADMVADMPTPRAPPISQPEDSPHYEDLTAVGGEPGKYRAIGLNAREAYVSWGRPQHEQKDPASGLLMLQCPKDDVIVGFVFCEQTICAAFYLNSEASQLDDARMKQVLRDNSDGMQWQATTQSGFPAWVRIDRQIIATRMGDTFSLSTPQYIQMVQSFHGSSQEVR
jgi:hypothetical protein